MLIALQYCDYLELTLVRLEVTLTRAVPGMRRAKILLGSERGIRSREHRRQVLQRVSQMLSMKVKVCDPVN